MKENRVKKIKKITRYLETKDLKPINDHKFLEALPEKASLHTPKFVSPKSLSIKHVCTISPRPPLVRESTFGFKPGTKDNQNIESRQVLPSFEEYWYRIFTKGQN
ncbi:hypothetical protein Tco_0429475 [Tanacetum coccineum]